MYCTKCGKEATQADAFCAKCGTPLDSQSIEQAAEPERKMYSHSAVEERWIVKLGRVKQRLIRRWVNLVQVILGIGCLVGCHALFSYSNDLINHVPVTSGQFMARDDVMLMRVDYENAGLGILILGILAGILLTKGLGGLFRK